MTNAQKAAKECADRANVGVYDVEERKNYEAIIQSAIENDREAMNLQPYGLRIENKRLRRRIAELQEKLNHYIEQQETFSHSLGETITDIKAKDKRIAELEKRLVDCPACDGFGFHKKDEKICLCCCEKSKGWSPGKLPLERASKYIRDKAERIAELEEQIRDSDGAYKDVMEENCAGDEHHCTCVPHLRERIAELEKALRRIRDSKMNRNLHEILHDTDIFRISLSTARAWVDHLQRLAATAIGEEGT